MQQAEVHNRTTSVSINRLNRNSKIKVSRKKRADLVPELPELKAGQPLG